MANKKATMTDLRLLIREFIKGTSKRKISEILNLSRTSIDVYLGRMDASGKSAEELLHSDDKTLSQVMVRDSGHRNTDSEKLFTVGSSYHVQIGKERHFYSIPYLCVGKKAKAVYDCHTVEIWADLERVAIHRRSFTDGYTTDPSHMPPNHIAYMRTKECNAAYFLDKSRLIGPHAHEVVENVLKSPYFVQQVVRNISAANP